MRRFPFFVSFLVLLVSGVSAEGVVVGAGGEENPVETLVIPAALMDEGHSRSELGVNEFTAPSIRRIFEKLEELPPIPQDIVLRAKPDKLPMDRGELALELGFLMADGFIIVQTGKLSEVRPLAQELSRYAKALGAGERVNRHAASLLKHAEEGNSDKLKMELSLTQRDVEAELISLRDPDLAHFIGLGGWIRALEVATAALDKEFISEKALLICQPDIPEYFEEALAGLDPLMLRRKDVAALRQLLKQLQQEMTLPSEEKPTHEQIKKLRKTTNDLSLIALTRINSK